MSFLPIADTSSAEMVDRNPTTPCASSCEPSFHPESYHTDSSGTYLTGDIFRNIPSTILSAFSMSRRLNPLSGLTSWARWKSRFTRAETSSDTEKSNTQSRWRQAARNAMAFASFSDARSGSDEGQSENDESDITQVRGFSRSQEARRSKSINRKTSPSRQASSEGEAKARAPGKIKTKFNEVENKLRSANFAADVSHRRLRGGKTYDRTLQILRNDDELADWTARRLNMRGLDRSEKLFSENDHLRESFGWAYSNVLRQADESDACLTFAFSDAAKLSEQIRARGAWATKQLSPKLTPEQCKVTDRHSVVYVLETIREAEKQKATEASEKQEKYRTLSASNTSSPFPSTASSSRTTAPRSSVHERHAKSANGGRGPTCEQSTESTTGKPPGNEKRRVCLQKSPSTTDQGTGCTVASSGTGLDTGGILTRWFPSTAGPRLGLLATAAALSYVSYNGFSYGPRSQKT